jgi:hypothetical protein
MRFRLRTLLMVLALGPPLLAGAWLFVTDMSAHDRSVTIQLLLFVIAAATILGAAWNARSVRNR